jgi:alkylation response protein AidB-like acyl-CoA dehydrogenase
LYAYLRGTEVEFAAWPVAAGQRDTCLKTSFDSLHEASSEDLELAARHHDQIDEVAAALEDALAKKDFAEFYHTFRSTDLPFLFPDFEHNTRGLFRTCFKVLHRLGGISPATALAIENHYYICSAIARFPAGDDINLEKRRNSLISGIVKNRHLVANTNSRIHGKKVGQIGTVARREGNGFRISGKAAYTSLASQSNTLLLLTAIEGEGPAIFAVSPMQGNPAIEIGSYLFPTAMVDSDTRQITFHDLMLPEETLLADAQTDSLPLIADFEMIWHQLLLTSLYLGAAARAIEEARKFLRATRGKDDQVLADLDGMVVDVGRLVIKYRSSCHVVFQAGDALSEIQSLPRDTHLLERAVELACMAKYVGTDCAERVVTASRKIVGGRSFTGTHPLERLSQEVMFASFAPEANAGIERRFGKEALGETPFPETTWE